MVIITYIKLWYSMIISKYCSNDGNRLWGLIENTLNFFVFIYEVVPLKVILYSEFDYLTAEFEFSNSACN